LLDSEEKINVSQAHRKLKEQFMTDDSIIKVNKKIKKASKISDKDVKLSVDLSTKNAWESSLMTYLDEIPFHYIGKGEQTIVKTKLALVQIPLKSAIKPEQSLPFHPDSSFTIPLYTNGRFVSTFF
jgi:putative ATP-dependent endonuclease of OLD family